MRSTTPKVLHDLCGLPMIAWPVAAAREAGAGTVVIVDGPGRASEAVLDDVLVAVQPVANGTGGALVAAVEHLADGAPVVVLSGDVPLISALTIRDLVAAHTAGGAVATVATTILDDPSGYGRIVRDAAGEVERIVETKTAGDATADELAIAEINSGVYVFEPGPLRDVLPRLSADNAQGELYLTDALALLREAGGRVQAHVVDDPAIVLGVNDRVHLAHVRKLARERIVEAHLRAGVDIVDPASVVIDASVTIGADSVIEPFTVLRGATRIGERCVIGPGSTLNDAVIGDEARVLHAYLVECEVRAGASVGPFAYLRPGTLLRERVKVGTFVEVKNSDIGEGTKVPHLSYLGDADVGAGSNLGAGSITANYDGVNKHRTTIGAGVRGSVHVSYVAPLTIGDRAWTAAGSVITGDVPEGALGIARERQSNLEGYDERRAAQRDAEE
jgi:bifunctional UDP-N-acetylglucosamine pyrophosphorylase / glucosamine-1-phosphate N-acetyltransferase